MNEFNFFSAYHHFTKENFGEEKQATLFHTKNQNKPYLLSSNYLPNFTAGLTFFIAVAATNLFHQGNWQRVFAAKNNLVLKKSLIYSSIITLSLIHI